MADSKSTHGTPTVDAAPTPVETVKADPQPQDEGSQRVQAAFDEATAKGYEGVNPVAEQLPNKVWSLQSGPDSPTISTATAAIVVTEPASKKKGR